MMNRSNNSQSGTKNINNISKTSPVNNSTKSLPVATPVTPVTSASSSTPVKAVPVQNVTNNQSGLNGVNGVNGVNPVNPIQNVQNAYKNKMSEVQNNMTNMKQNFKNAMNDSANSFRNQSRMPARRRGNGFPRANCSGLASLFDNSCMENEDPLTIIDASNNAFVNITNAAIHFAVTTGAVGLNKVLDVLSFTILGIDNLSIDNKDAIMEQLEEKMVLFQYLANDEQSRMMVKKLFGSLAVIIMEGTEEAKVPLMRAFHNLTSSTVQGMNSLMQSGSEFVKNAIKIIPGIGDAYIILDNAFQVGIAGTHASAVLAKNADTMVSTADEITRRIRAKVEPPLEAYESSMDELNSIRNNLDQLDLASALQNAETQISQVY